MEGVVSDRVSVFYTVFFSFFFVCYSQQHVAGPVSSASCLEDRRQMIQRNSRGKA